jgi:putative two-component system response regulator
MDTNGIRQPDPYCAINLSRERLVLVVDDDGLNRELMSRMVADMGYATETADDGVTALERLREQMPDLIVLDINMPLMNGFEVLEQLKVTPEWKNIPVIVVTAESGNDNVVRGIELGAEDYLRKPVNPAIFAARVNASLDKKRLLDLEFEHRRHIEHYNEKLEQQVAEQVRVISEGHVATIFAMSKLAESRDPETGEHLERIREYCQATAAYLAETPEFSSLITSEFIRTIYATSPLHDIGKVGIPDMILLKPDRLDDDEMAVMKTHASIGAFTLEAVHRKYPQNKYMQMGIEIAHHHHEKWDGSGYPDGLAGDAIPLSARICALADVYDALRSPRVYKPAFSHEKSRDIIVEGRGQHFQPEVVDAFLVLEDEFVEIQRRWSDPQD